MSYEQDHNHTRTDQIAPTLRVSWSQPRCWHGDTLTIHVRGAYVLDNSDVDLKIYVVGSGAVFDTVPTLKMNGNTIDHPYKIDWKAKVIPVGAASFEVKAELQVPAIVSPASDPLFVDLITPVFSA